MKKERFSQIIERLQQLSLVQGGVFSFGDLCSLIAAGNEIENSKSIRQLVQVKILQKVSRGIYTTKNPDLWILASRIKPNAYISMDSVLAKNGLVGTLPERSVSLVSTSRKLVIETSQGFSLRFFSIQPNLFFGFSSTEKGVLVSDNEKAYLDLLYFYIKGASYVFDPLSEVNFQKLDKKKIMSYLKSYQNPKFVKFVKGVLQ